MIEVLFAFIAISIRISTQHFVYTPAPSCELANTCNHTWVSLCGQDQQEFTNRLFVDECDMHEYNCDNSKAYIPTELKVCLYKCTREILASTSNTKSTQASIIKSTKSVDETATTITAVTTTTQSTTHPEETSHFEISQTTATESVTTEATMTTVDSTTSNTTTEETTSQSTTTSVEENSSEHNISLATESQSSVVEESTTMSPETSSTSPITDGTTITETADSIVNDSTSALESETTTSTKPTEETSSTGQITTKCTSYPQDCFVPSTWETTLASENRDFFQILRQRFGDKFEIVRDPISFPKPGGRMGRKMGRNGDVFIAGHHKETNDKNYFVH